MIIKCQQCSKYFDDEFRNIACPHEAFLANNGQNQFKIYDDAWLSDEAPKRGFSCKEFVSGGQSEHDSYQNWLNNNKIKLAFEDQIKNHDKHYKKRMEGIVKNVK